MILRVHDLSLSDVRLVVLDKDGTLIDLYFYWSKMLILRAQQICLSLEISLDEYIVPLVDAMGIDLKHQRLKEVGPVGLHSREVVQQAAANYLSSLGIGAALEICREAFLKSDQLSEKYFASWLNPVDGVLDFIQQLKKEKILLAMATTDKTQRAILTLKTLQIDSLFDMVIGFDMVKHSKPSADMLNLICHQLKVMPAHAVMIGDTYSDCLMSAAAGFQAAIAIKGSLVKEEQLKSLTPFIITSFKNIEIVPE